MKLKAILNAHLPLFQIRCQVSEAIIHEEEEVSRIDRALDEISEQRYGDSSTAHTGTVLVCVGGIPPPPISPFNFSP